MRARLAIQSSGIKVQLREIVLSDKAPTFLVCSPKGTVPVVVTKNDVIEDSLDIMRWALTTRDPEGWLQMPYEGHEWIARNDGPFKDALDHTKYSVRYPNLDSSLERKKAGNFLDDLNTQIASSPWMFGKKCSLADMAIIPFVRQFSYIDNHWFDAQGWQNVDRWLTAFLDSDKFNTIMTRYDKWITGDPDILFPNQP